jgi:HK97 family phage portal protein
MSFLDTLSGILRMEPAPPWPVETLSILPSDIISPWRLTPAVGSAWHRPSVRQAMGVPAIFRAVSLISSTAASLPMEVWRNGELLPPEGRPRLAVKPNPLATPQSFWKLSVGWKARYGETWWYVAKRDVDGRALSLWPVPPYEVKVEANRADRLRPRIRWLDRLMPNEDMILDRWEPDPEDEYRGVGPLQLCGSAVSVAVEAQEWAASFYSEGGFPSVYLKSDYHFEDEDEPTKIKSKWTATPPNTPHVLSPGLDVGSLPVNPDGAQMLSARVHNNGEVALMFGIPGSMLEYVQSGSSLTYQNVGQRFDDFVKSCLKPLFLVGAEQALSELLPRSMTAKFDTDVFTRADPKTRMEIHKLAIESGVYGPDYAQMQEGIVPGDSETAPVEPVPSPAAVPTGLPTRLSMRDVRCRSCSRLLGRAEGTAELRCSHCKTIQLDVRAA